MQNHTCEKLQVRLKIKVLLLAKNGLRSNPIPSNWERFSWGCIPPRPPSSCAHMLCSASMWPQPFHKEAIQCCPPPPPPKYQMSSAAIDLCVTNSSFPSYILLISSHYFPFPSLVSSLSFLLHFFCFCFCMCRWCCTWLITFFSLNLPLAMLWIGPHHQQSRGALRKRFCMLRTCKILQLI